jgi:release factor glutamine methyltransferase
MMTSIAEWRYQSLKILKKFSDTADIEINAILSHVLKKDLAWILSHSEFILGKNNENILSQKLDLLKDGFPLPYLLEEKEFFGLMFQVNPNVLIPRPETETMVELAIDWLYNNQPIKRVIDVGTGSGAIIISILNQFPEMNGIGVDISRKAIEMAKINKIKLGMDNLEFVQMDCLSGFSEKFDLVCANLPYIPDGELETLKVSKYEPRIALSGGVDGLAIINGLIEQLRYRINSPGLVLLEIQNDQASKVVKIVNQVLPTSKISVIKDYSNNDRVIRIELKNA